MFSCGRPQRTLLSTEGRLSWGLQLNWVGQSHEYKLYVLGLWLETNILTSPRQESCRQVLEVLVYRQISIKVDAKIAGGSCVFLINLSLGRLASVTASRET